jgi:beta-glucosidase
MQEKRFPEGFLGGAATSAFQVEGNIKNMDWEEAAVKNLVPKLGRAADHFNCYEADFDLARSLGHNAHRFSIEWARIEPEEGKFDQAAVLHYRKVLEALNVRGIKPFVTIWHFTLPLWFSHSGGFERKDSPEIFARYAAFVVEQLGDLCEHFSTINEPNVYASHGWLYGAWPPFRRGQFLWLKFGKEDGTWRSAQITSHGNILRYIKVTNNLARAHNLAYDRIKAISPKTDVSIVKHVRVFEANGNPLNKLLAIVARYAQSGYFMDKVIAKCDSVGLNYSRHTKFGETRTYQFTDMGWKVYPEGIEYALKYLWKYRKPIYITEAGLADAKDTMRAEYIKNQVAGTWQAIQDGVDVRAHLYWSFMDNYELALGFEKRFGLVEINYDTLERTVRPSAYVYKEIIERNAVVE